MVVDTAVVFGWCRRKTAGWVGGSWGSGKGSAGVEL